MLARGINEGLGTGIPYKRNVIQMVTIASRVGSTWMSQEVSKRLGSVGYNPKEYPSYKEVTTHLGYCRGFFYLLGDDHQTSSIELRASHLPSYKRCG